MLRLISCFVVALTLFLSPLAMVAGGQAMAHAPFSQSEGISGHCSDANKQRGEQKPDVKIACANACAALHPQPIPVGEDQQFPKTETSIGPPQTLTGISPEGETPPPRITPEI